MNKFLLLLFCVTFFIAAKGQSNYAEAMKQGDAALQNGQYKRAIDKYFAAEAFDPTKKEIVKKKVKLTFDRIEELRQDAINSKRDAENALKDAQKQRDIAANALKETQKQRERVDSALKETQKEKDRADSSFRNFRELKKTVIGAKYQGGIVFYWNDKTGKHGLIAAENDLGEFNWEEAKDTCDTLSLNGYSDWRLPTMDELGALYANRNVVGGFALSKYWSSDEINKAQAGCESFNYGVESNYCYKSAKIRVRLVRSF